MTSTLSVIALVIWLRSTAYTFKEGDLVLFGGKFTLDEKKLMLIIKMACLMDLKVGQTTRSLIYSPFHQTAHYINFEVGYSKDTKWFDSLNDKKSVNTFALKRNESASRSVSSTRTKFDDSNKKNSIVIDDDEPAFQSTTDNNELSKLEMQTKPNLEKQDQSSRMTPSTAHLSPTPTYRSQKCKLSDLCNLEESNNDPDNDPNNFGNNPGNGNDPVNDPFRLECTYYRQESGKGGRGGRGGKGKRG
ncbi:hypothetical protein GLOIN_2v1793760 [Rhizophagus irregularis DAOM 181602=DAOM 197198]|nr:hypothetical protein GLOIN_2v1793760 [Rhizophagus irregularis DAOM 181602=DAOM 197198]